MRAMLLCVLTTAWAVPLLSGCNGLAAFLNPTSTTLPTGNQTAVGVWSGSDSFTGLTVTAIVSSTGQAAFLRSDGVQFVGTVAMTGTDISVSVTGYANFGTTFSDGTSTGSGTVSGTISSGSSMTVTLNFTTSGNFSMTGNWTLSFDALTNNGSSIGAVSANYSDSATGIALSIDGLGDVNSQDPTTGCVLNGTISTADTTFDIYQIDFTLKSCTGAYAVLNDVELSGLAVLNTDVSPTQLVVAVTGNSSRGQFGITSYYNAT
jgi:hypothetical protein